MIFQGLRKSSLPFAKDIDTAFANVIYSQMRTEFYA